MRRGNAPQSELLAMLSLKQESANIKQGRPQPEKHPVCGPGHRLCPPDCASGGRQHKGLTQFLPVGDAATCSALSGWTPQLPEHTHVDQVEMVGDSGHVLKVKVAWSGDGMCF